ncbi:response regulator receiver modulated diguanylate cyclase [Gloeothece citriformis PCC 7424]|uniref:Response regulator receiver modulated diguanylate cyclase n=1 Tax=Gloeothece citriformis (strain PCC 7424) TaxID=65393 RepID=B7KGX5_GLOC7|nr:response regulator [Gloeothece citriformis]ACK73462.1 response regulator receiver modulated diguanylate cyclase [Gloeothece citriformis PCC 7424]
MSIENKNLKILLIEDNFDEAELIREMINLVVDASINLTHESYLKDGLKCLDNNQYDIILLDLRLPDNDDLSSINKIKNKNATVPIIVLSSIQDKDIAVEAVRKGAQDYLYKGQFDSELLGRAIRYAIERQRIQEQLKKQIEREQLIGRMTESIRKSLELREILETTVHEVRQFLKADRVIIYGCQDKSSPRTVTESVAPKQKNNTSVLADFESLYQSYLCNLELQEEQEQNLEGAVVSLTNSILTVPIWQNYPEKKARLWGQLLAQDCSGCRQWQPWEIEFLIQLSNSVAIAIQQSELYLTVQRQAMLDGLTGIANRRQFDRILEQEWQRLAHQQEEKGVYYPISLIMCDVDFFKNYNTVYGHLGGDDCLKQVAQVIQQSSQRASDLAARYGGEEFAVILSGTDAKGALKVAKNIRSTLHQLKIPHQDSLVSQYVTLSMGIATKIPSFDTNPIELINLADQALQQAKTQGRDRIIQSLI